MFSHPTFGYTYPIDKNKSLKRLCPSSLINANNNIMVALSKQLEDIKSQANKLGVYV